MTVAGVLMLVVAAAWLGLGLKRVVWPGEPPRMRPARRAQGALLVFGSGLLAVTAIAVLRS